MKLEMYRLSLSERDQPKMRVDSKGLYLAPDMPTRFDFLARAFGHPFSYSPRADMRMKYMPLESDQGIIAAIVAKLTFREGRHDETDPLALVESPDWEVCHIFLNLNDDEQIIAFDRSTALQSSTAKILEGLVKHLNEQDNALYKIDAFPVHSENEFWESVSEYDGKITSLRFDFVVPNPPDTTSPTKDALKELRRQVNARRHTEIIRNEEGLDLQNDYVRDREEYASSGNGETLVRDGNQTVYNSRERVKVVEFPEEFDTIKIDYKGVFPRLSHILRDILKRK